MIRIKKVKKLISCLLYIQICMFLGSCKDNAQPADSFEFQKNMHQSTSKDIPYLCETENGYYFQYDAFAYYIDKKSKKATVLCAKPECNHNDNSCNAWIYCSGLSYFKGKVYFVNRDYVLKNGKYTDYGILLYSMEQDGTSHDIVQSLEFTPGGDTSQHITAPIIYKGKVYFVYSGVLYCVSLGENIVKAEKIYGEEVKSTSGAFQLMNPDAVRYTLWADQNDMYFMVNIKQTNGTYKDTLFSYDPESKELKQRWQVPDASVVGEWQTTGVSVSQWYLTNGFLYFYLSGGDFWRVDLNTGVNEKMAETSRMTKYGTAIFSDQYMCLLNDGPGDGINLINNSKVYTGGDLIYVYGLDGTLRKEISLKELYDKNSKIEHCEMISISENDIYFLVDATTWNKPIGGISSPDVNLILCCADIETGEITEVYSWN